MIHTLEIGNTYQLKDGNSYKVLEKKGITLQLENVASGEKLVKNTSTFLKNVDWSCSSHATQPEAATQSISRLVAKEGKTYILKDEKYYQVLAIVGNKVKVQESETKEESTMDLQKFNDDLLHLVDMSQVLPPDTVGRKAFLKLDDKVERKGIAFDTKFEAENKRVYDGELYKRLKESGNLRYY